MKRTIDDSKSHGDVKTPVRPMGFQLSAEGTRSGPSSKEMGYLINLALQTPFAFTGYFISEWLHETYPDRELVEGTDWHFDLEAFARDGQCAAATRPAPYPQRVTEWEGAPDGDGEITIHARQTWYEVAWHGNQLDVLVMHWKDGVSSTLHFFILAESGETGRDFLRAVCAWNAVPREEVIAYDGDEWTKDKKLFAAIATASFDGLILAGDIKETLRRDAHAFFASRELYAEYGVPWKRGMLLYGPPGNGKTHALKALIRELGVPCLYVKSFRYRYGPDELSIQEVFGQARMSSPCVLVLEDLDTLITRRNRSYFLNELDGFASNDGILVLATSNHPRRLDPAIVNRPSRFDRKFAFDLPGLPERLAYLSAWNTSLKPTMQCREATLAAAARLSDDFSFAYLKELCLGSAMQWVAEPDRAPMDALLIEQTDALRRQMASSRKRGKKGKKGGQSVDVASGDEEWSSAQAKRELIGASAS